MDGRLGNIRPNLADDQDKTQLHSACAYHTILICSPPVQTFLRPMDLLYDLGSPAINVNLIQYFPYERLECRPVLEMGAEPASAPLDTQIFSLNDYALTI